MGNGIGRLTVSVEPIAFDKDIQKRNIDLQPGNYVHVSVTDTGAGIEDRYLNQIFDPYFTTRERGVGTGLGLPIVHGIVKSHKGHIEVKSQVGKGSTFHVYLPLLPGRELQAQEKDIPILPRGSECILIVDDEHLIVQMEQQSLERLGYTVEPRTSSIEALKAFQAQPEKFDMAIIDMTMPNMTGDTLADELKKLRPDIPIILCTGFSERIDNETHIPNIDAFLFKPVDREEMARTVRKLLDDAKKESCD
jgi:CheY-like chemotaxis protein